MDVKIQKSKPKFPDFDRQTAAQFLATLKPDGSVAELRCPDHPKRNATTAGYFDDPNKLLTAAGRLSGRCPGVFITINEVNPALLARINNRVEEYPKQTTSDGADNIQRRRWLFIDIDPVRPAGIPATDEEHALALEAAGRIRDWLSGQGWTRPLEADSGNGAALYYKIDLANNDGAKSLIKRCLEALAWRFDSEQISVDTSCFNASRIAKLIGTLSRKGDETDDRPHRLSRLLSVPESCCLVSDDLLESLARQGPPPPPKFQAVSNGFDLGEWIARHNLPVAFEGPWEKGHRWILNPCPWNPEHTNRSAYIVQFANGAIAAGCHHHSCQGHDWPALRELFEPGYRERRGPRSQTQSERDSSQSTSSARSEDSRPEPWDEPIPLDKVPAVEDFPLDVLPAPLAGLIGEIAWSMNCAPDLAGVALLTLAGGAIANSRHLAITETHLVSPCLYAVVIASPGMTKSPPLRLLRRPFDLAEANFRREWKAELEKWKEAQGEDRGPKPTLTRCQVSNVTTESLQIILDENPRGVLMVRNELSGLLAGLNQYKRGGGDDRQFYLDLWDGTPIITDRKSDRAREGAPVFVQDAFTAIYGTIQPEVVTILRPDGGRRRAAINDGFIDRFLFAYPRDIPAVGEQWRAVTSLARSQWEDTIRELLSLQMQATSDKLPRPVLLHLDAQGRSSWERFTKDLAAEINGDDFPPHLRGPWMKLKAYGGRLALILRCLRWACATAAGEVDELTQVEGVDMDAAIRLVHYFQSHTRKVDALIDTDPRRREAQRVLRWLSLNSLKCLNLEQGIKKSDLHAGVWGGSKDVDEVSDILSLLVRYGWLRLCHEEERKGPGRRASPRYEVHPCLIQRSDISENSENPPREAEAQELPAGYIAPGLTAADTQTPFDPELDRQPGEEG
jgi:hypothetical protein